jgi:hypothetical protein
VHIRALNNAQVVCDVGVGRCNWGFPQVKLVSSYELFWVGAT